MWKCKKKNLLIRNFVQSLSNNQLAYSFTYSLSHPVSQFVSPSSTTTQNKNKKHIHTIRYFLLSAQKIIQQQYNIHTNIHIYKHTYSTILKMFDQRMMIK